MADHLFENASRLKLRFKTPIGFLSVEDLWELPLIGGRANLDDLAKDLRKQVRDSADESFVVKTTKPNEELVMRFDITRRIIDVRLQEKEDAENAEKRRQKKEQVMALIAEKETESLKESSIDELRELLNGL